MAVLPTPASPRQHGAALLGLHQDPGDLLDLLVAPEGRGELSVAGEAREAPAELLRDARWRLGGDGAGAPGAGGAGAGPAPSGVRANRNSSRSTEASARHRSMRCEAAATSAHRRSTRRTSFPARVSAIAKIARHSRLRWPGRRRAAGRPPARGCACAAAPIRGRARAADEGHERVGLGARRASCSEGPMPDIRSSFSSRTASQRRTPMKRCSRSVTALPLERASSTARAEGGARRRAQAGHGAFLTGPSPAPPGTPRRRRTGCRAWRPPRSR